MTEHKLQDIDNKINDLKRIRSVIIKLIHRYVNEEISTDECPILEAITQKNRKEVKYDEKNTRFNTGSIGNNSEFLCLYWEECQGKQFGLPS